MTNERQTNKGAFNIDNNGRYREQELVLEEGFHSLVRAIKEPAGKVINCEMIELLLERTGGDLRGGCCD